MQNHPDGPPKYPDPEFYRNYQAPSQTPGYEAPHQAPRLEPFDPYSQARQQQMRPTQGHNAFSRFVIAWGGWNRLWIMLGTMAASIVVYYLYAQSWTFALGFTVLLLIHELGHAFTIRLKKMRATFPIFVPGLGAFVTLPNQPISLRDDAEISLAGPFLGGVAAALCIIPAFLFLPTNRGLSHVFLALALYGLVLNLLNLIPILPFDGGHIGQVLSPWLSVAGLAILGLLYFYTQNYFFLIFGIVGLSYVTQGFNSPARRVAMRRADRNIVAVMYMSLATLLAVGFWAIHQDGVLFNALLLRGY